MIKKITYKFKDWYKSSETRRIFTIPVGDVSREDAEKTIRELMALYHEEIEFPEGVILKSNNIDHNKDIWYPNNSIGL